MSFDNKMRKSGNHEGICLVNKRQPISNTRMDKIEVAGVTAIKNRQIDKIIKRPPEIVFLNF